MFTRRLCAWVGWLYLALSLYCTLLPGLVAASYGIVLEGAAAHSEWFTVYGGLQAGLGLAFVLGSRRASLVPGLVFLGLCLHLGLVLWRQLSFALYGVSGWLIPSLAITEALLALGFALAWWLLPNAAAPGDPEPAKTP